MKPSVQVSPYSLSAVAAPVQPQETAPLQKTTRLPAALALAATDLTLLLGCWLAATLLGVVAVQLTFSEQLILIGPVVLLPLILAGLGLYPGYGMARHERLRRRWLATLCFFGLALAASEMMPRLQWASSILALTGLSFMLVAPLAEDLVRILLRNRQQWGKPALLLGPPEAVQAMARELHANWWLGLRPTTNASTADIDTLILSPGMVMAPEFSSYPNIYCVSNPSEMEFVGNAPLALHRANPRTGLNRLLKRGLDISVGSLALLAALPVIAVFAGLVYLTDRHLPFYYQPRSGLNGKRLKVWKIRSMYKDADVRLKHLLATDPVRNEEWLRYFKLKNDPRVLPRIGGFIRKYSIDELPQLWSVVKGEISLVGPRVFADYDLEVYSPEQLRMRQTVVPGLSGLWQVSGRSSGDNFDKVRYDMAYVRNWSLWLDLDILYRTIGVVLTARGAI